MSSSNLRENASEAAAHVRRRAGLLLPLSAIRTHTNWGVGEISDIPRLSAWASRAGFSVVQLLPINEVCSGETSPYAAGSAFAIDPVYLSLDDCADFAAAGGRDALPPHLRREIEELSAAKAVDFARVRELKSASVHVAFEHFLRHEWQQRSVRARELTEFQQRRREWLDDHALFSVLHRLQATSWIEWPEKLRNRDPAALAELKQRHAVALLETEWLQWQLDLQWHEARRAANRLGVELMGDLPFTVNSDSADVWSNPTTFRTDLRVGTPPDEFSETGQDWGLPVYDWAELEREDFAWLRRRARRAGELFGLYRLDHVIGFYRTYFRSADGKRQGYLPEDRGAQVRLGETILGLMRESGELVAEDLGTVPDFVPPSLARLGVAGYRVLRWEKDDGVHRDPATWPELSVATNSTHDLEMTAEWYDNLSVEERRALLELPTLRELDPTRPFDERVRDALLETIYASASMLALVPLQDAMGDRDRINVPGTVGGGNWTYRMRPSVEDLLGDVRETERLYRLSERCGRTPPND